MVVFICIFSDDGRLLIQQRDLKKSWGGYWDVSAAGAVISGEDSTDAAMRETKEELGLDLKRDRLYKAMSLYYDKHIHDIFIYNAGPGELPKVPDGLRLQQGEVAGAKWADKAEVCSMLENREFIPVYKEFIELLFAMHKSKGIMLT
ncbi:MAG: NUDIX domain-containing protein [Eubacteriales bacterium]|nr:NUDIX domain-containing protein [Eubacteriales bacterium]